MQQDLASRQPDVENIGVKAQHLQAAESKMAAGTSQLYTRYQTLKTTVKVYDQYLSDMS